MENVDLTPELISKVKTAKSAEELIKIAEGEGVKLDEKDAASFFAKLNRSGKELADDQLDSVAGGGYGNQLSLYPAHDWEDCCKYQQDAAGDPYWQGTCHLCVYSEDGAKETVRCHYPIRVRFH